MWRENNVVEVEAKDPAGEGVLLRKFDRLC